MEIYKEGRYWYIKSPHGPLPKALRGAWTTDIRAREAVEMFQKGVQAKAVNVSARNRHRKERYEASHTTATAGSE